MTDSPNKIQYSVVLFKQGSPWLIWGKVFDTFDEADEAGKGWVDQMKQLTPEKMTYGVKVMSTREKNKKVQ